MANAAISDELEDELPNIHQALDWYIEREEADGAVSIVLAMSQFWMKRGYLVEGSRLMERAVEFVDRIEPVTQVRMLRSSAWFICVGGEYDEALVRVKRAVEMARTLDRPEELAWAINGLGVIHYYREEIDEARAALVESLSIAEPGTRYRLGALNNLGVIARQQGNLEAARDYFQQCIDEERTYSLHDPEAHSLLNLVDVQLRLGERAAAQERLNDWFSERRRMRSLELAAVGLWVAARIATDEGDAERAAQMLGWSDDQLKRLSISDPHADEPDVDMRDRLSDALGVERFDELRAAGRELTIEQVIEMAVRVPGARTSTSRQTITRPAPAGLDPLTAREIEVARLVAAGKSTREIAETLFISARTTQTHVTNILGKLDLESLAALAAWVVRNDPDTI
ncbi:MAG: LuxR C-terminal-related transcriptional regulator [Thermomicrobiales bacterium]